jgi:hypothetical protein
VFPPDFRKFRPGSLDLCDRMANLAMFRGGAMRPGAEPLIPPARMGELAGGGPDVIALASRTGSGSGRSATMFVDRIGGLAARAASWSRGMKLGQLPTNGRALATD